MKPQGDPHYRSVTWQFMCYGVDCKWYKQEGEEAAEAAGKQEERACELMAWAWFSLTQWQRLSTESVCGTL